MIFDHFHFLLECPELMSQFIHIIKSQVGSTHHGDQDRTRGFHSMNRLIYNNALADNNVFFRIIT